MHRFLSQDHPHAIGDLCSSTAVAASSGSTPIHHADDHRSQVLSILGARGLDVPEPNGLDVWGYAEAMGLMVPMASGA